MAAFFQTTFSKTFSSMKMYKSLIKISLTFVPEGPINNIPALVQIMAWRRTGDEPLSEPMMVSLLTHICVTRPQWVNIYMDHIFSGVYRNPTSPSPETSRTNDDILSDLLLLWWRHATTHRGRVTHLCVTVKLRLYCAKTELMLIFVDWTVGNTLQVTLESK